MEEILQIVEDTNPTLRWVVVDASEINNVDYTAAKTLLQLRAELGRRGVGMAAIAVHAGVRRQFERYREFQGPAAHREIFSTADAAIEGLRDVSPSFHPVADSGAGAK
jgi:MFS superfamily sulfate permease-like transporter